MSIFGKKPSINKDEFSSVIKTLKLDFESSREEFVFNSISQMKRYGKDVTSIPRDITPGSQLEDILKGFQLTSMIGIAWDHIKDIKEMLLFDEMLSEEMEALKESRANNYREKYKGCSGDMERLAITLSEDIHEALAIDTSDRNTTQIFKSGAYFLIGTSQHATYSVCGNQKMADKIRKRMVEVAGK